ncbi:MAG TPA: hypothetical protein VMN60_11370 [Longimicrobiales bacterium]|nr:hypothetical protein [Longimicrobiales bacterium]
MYGERETRDILERALELDEQRRAVMTREQIIEVAAELGVSRYAIDAALAERAGMPAHATSREPRLALDALRTRALQPGAARGGLSALRVLNISLFAGIASGLLAGGMIVPPVLGPRGFFMPMSMSGMLMIMLVFGGLVMASGGMALSDRTRSGLHYVARNAALWLGFGAGGMLAAGLFAKFGPVGTIFPTAAFEATLAFSLAGGAITTVVGATFLAVREALRASPLRPVSFGDGGTGGDGGPRSGAGPGDGTRNPAFARARLRVLKRLRDWLGTSARSLVTGLSAQHSA